MVVIALYLVEVDVQREEVLTHLVVEQHSATILDAELYALWQFGGDDHIIGYPLEAKRHLQVILEFTIEGLQQPKASSHKEKKQKKEELPAPV